MLWILRLLSITVGAATAWRVLDGSMTQTLFKVPCLAAGALLVITALLPRATASVAMVASSAYALGVFSILLASYMVPGRPVDPLLMAAMAVNLTTAALLFPRGEH